MKTEIKGLYEIGFEEAKSINGGTWISYSIGYVCGIAHNIYKAWSTTPEGAAVQQALKDFQ